MKIAIMLLALTASFNSFALDLTVSPFLSTALSVAGGDFKVAQEVVNDSQAFYQTGELSVKLSAQVSGLIAENSELSVQEAVDALATYAAKVLE